ncbi:MAG: hypothetical protein QF450_11950 [Rhodospirillales bacterium]|jgi:transcription initiation factor IIE alpha subunit|nr:hypothetical protein [Rhodospirillales bacterium]HJO71537.1 hypothetical protein [Rhodospirillales bacterium]
MGEKDRGLEERAASLPKELVGVDCPRCEYRISQDSEVVFHREDQYFVGYNLTCPKCGNEFAYTLYFK